MFSTEAELQAYCLRVLQSKGIRAQAEVPAGNLRADIVTPSTIYELKRVLTREAIYQALGQATAYQAQLGRSKHICIVGQLPSHFQERDQARRIASDLESD